MKVTSRGLTKFCRMNEKLVGILVASRLKVLGSSLKMPYLSYGVSVK